MSSQDQSQAGLGEGPVSERNSTKYVWDTLEADGRFTRFLQAAREAQIENNLRGPDFITVFAVPDDVIGSEAEEVLRNLAPKHVIRGYQTAADLRTAATVRTLDGPPVTVSYEDGRAKFGDATVEHSDIACLNGMIHILNRLMKDCAYAG
ncbi:MAG TPA: fasciclin domain-containing protein [Bryobacteraceae bacterium]|nr:fasciclin domain-containing protein [Bryobacteraceae bacterium]